jgi:hypothetical protein
VLRKQQILPLRGRGLLSHGMFAALRTLQPVSETFPVRSKNRLKKDSGPGLVGSGVDTSVNFGLRNCFSYNN